MKTMTILNTLHHLSVAGIAAVVLATSATVPAAPDKGLFFLNGWSLAQTQGFHPSSRDSASVFEIPGTDTFGIFGGFSEALDISGSTAPTTNRFFNDLFIFDASDQTWAQLSSGVGPSPRGFTCAVYHEITDSIVVFGGTRFAADFSSFTYLNDLWQFDLSTQQWSEILTAGPRPSARAGFGCGIIGDELYVFSGNGANFSTDNELWRYDIIAQSWTLLQADAADNPYQPVARTQMIFERIPGRNEFLMSGGDAFVLLPEPPFLDAVTQNDVWIYDADSNQWTELDSGNAPRPVRNLQAAEMISERFLLVQSGDAQGDLTVDETCPAPMFCLLPASPTSATFLYDLYREKWTEIEFRFGSVPPTRRSTMQRLGNSVYLFGGYGWDGENTVGKIANPYTWELKLPRQLKR